MRRTLLCLAVTFGLLLTTGCEDHRTPAQAGASWFRPIGQESTALCIIDKESGGKPGGPPSPTNDYGLFQINYVHRADFERLTGRPWFPAIYDPVLNGQYARVLYEYRGWRSWTTWRLCT